MIGSDISVTVISAKGNQVRIGIDAPKDVAVHREEVFDRIKREKAGAAANESDGESEPEDEAAPHKFAPAR